MALALSVEGVIDSRRPSASAFYAMALFSDEAVPSLSVPGP